jgi:hypothetical protein
LWSVNQKYVTKIEQPNFIKHYTIYYAQFNSCLHGKSFIATSKKKTKFYRFIWKWVKFELQVLYSLLMIFFPKIIFRYKIIYFIRDSQRVLQDSIDLGTFMPAILAAFQARWVRYGHNHDIVCSYDLILCTWVHIRMKNNVHLGSFNFCCTNKSFFILLVQKLGFFVKRLPKICYKSWTTKF